MIVSLKEMKNYLRVDDEEDDDLIRDLIHSSEKLCMEIARIDDVKEFNKDDTARIAVMYAVAYFYEHREEADHHTLTLSLRSLLAGTRKAGF